MGGHPRAGASGLVPATRKMRTRLNCEAFSDERNLHAVSTFTPAYQPTWWSGRAQHTVAEASTMWLSEVIGEMVPKNPTTLRAIQLPGESIDHVLVRASTLLPLFSSGDK